MIRRALLRLLAFTKIMMSLLVGAMLMRVICSTLPD